MKFRNFEFPVDPEILTVSTGNRISANYGAYGQTIINDCGYKTTVINGEGEFFGENCLESFENLSAEMSEGGILHLPDDNAVFAYPEKLEKVFSDTENVIRYRFRFIINAGEKISPAPKIIYSKGTNCLWDISNNYGINIDILVQLNPHIERPDRTIDINERIILW